jgi:hypothetical protein
MDIFCIYYFKDIPKIFNVFNFILSILRGVIWEF